MEAFQKLLSAGPFIPHGHCYLWQKGLVWLHLTSDALIVLSYYLIALALLYFIQQREDVPFRHLFWLFAAFITACGTTHALEIWTLWFPTYWVSGTVKALTALISFYTALELIPRIPQALALPSPLQLEALNASLSKEIAERKAAEATVQQLNQDLEQRVNRRTQELENSKLENERLLQQEQKARSELQTTLDNLQCTAERLNIALGAAQMGTWDWNLEQQQQFWSPRTEAILGFIPGTAKFTYQTWAERVYPEDLPRLEAAIDRVQQTHEILSETYRVLWPDQSLHWVLTQGRVVFSADGQPKRMIGVVQEITEAKQAALALQNSEARFRAVFDQSAVGMARLDPAGRWLQVNQALCHLLGYTPDELIGHPLEAVTDPADSPLDDLHHCQMLEEDVNACRFEKRYLHKSGTPIWTMVTVSTERSEDHQLVGFIAVIEDIHSLKQARIELQQRATELESVNFMLAKTTALLEKRNEELDQFAYVASHDLKAPLRAIANLSEWIEEDLRSQLPDENRHQLSLLRSRVRRMEALINGLLEYSRVGRREQRIEVVEMDVFLSEILDYLNIPDRFTVVLPPILPSLKTNRITLSQVFSNLISNSVKHHDREDGRIEIAYKNEGNYVEFSIIDDGPGIAPEYHKKVFTIFQTLKARDEFESTGIGLSIVKKIVESEGGRIWVESDVGQGAAFRFTWPQKEVH